MSFYKNNAVDECASMRKPFSQKATTANLK